MGDMRALQNEDLLHLLYENADLQPSPKNEKVEQLKLMQDSSRVDDAILRLQPSQKQFQLPTNKLKAKNAPTYEPANYDAVLQISQSAIEVTKFSPKTVVAPKSPKLDVFRSMEDSLHGRSPTRQAVQPKQSVIDDDEVLNQLIREIKQKKQLMQQDEKLHTAPQPVKQVVKAPPSQDLSLSKTAVAEQPKKGEKRASSAKKFVNAEQKQEELVQTLMKEALKEVGKEESQKVMQVKKPAPKVQKKPKVQKGNVIKEKNGYTYEFLDTLVGDQKIIAITKISTGQRVYRKVPRFQYDQLIGNMGKDIGSIGKDIVK